MGGARLRILLLALVSGALAAAIWTLLGGSEREDAAPHAAAEVPQHASPCFAVAPASAPAPAEASVQPLLAEPVAAAAAVESELRLLVVREGDEAPLVGVSTDVETSSGEQSALTDASGRVRLTVPPGPLEVRISETVSTRIGRARFEAAGDQRLVVPHRGGEMTGRVVDPDGDPVQGAEVLFWHAQGGEPVDWDHPVQTTLTDAEGAFALQDTAGWEGDTVRCLIAARTSDHVSLFALASETSEHYHVHGAQLVLGDAPPIRGRVRSASGGRVRATVDAQADCGAYLAWCAARPAPLPDGAWLQPDAHCSVHPLRLMLVCDDDGRFLLPGLADRWTFHVRADGLPAARAERDAANDGSPIEIVLLAPLAPHGTVRDAAGAPVRGACVTIWPRDGRGAVETDGSGSWRFDDASPALARLTITCPGYATLCEDVDFARAPPGPHDVVLQPGHTLTGIVLDAQGRSLLWATVQLANDASAGIASSSTGESERPRLIDHDLACTQDRGTFRFDSLASGRYRLELIEDLSDRVLGATLASAGDSNVRLVQGEGLDLIARVSGRVVDAAGQARTDVVIRVQAYADAEARRLTLETDISPDETARFALEDMAPGWVRLDVWPLPDALMPKGAWKRSRGEPLLTWGPLKVEGGSRDLELRLTR